MLWLRYDHYVQNIDDQRDMYDSGPSTPCRESWKSSKGQAKMARRPRRSVDGIGELMGLGGSFYCLV